MVLSRIDRPLVCGSVSHAVRRAMHRDRAGRTSFVPGTALIAREATAVILVPVAAIDEAATRWTARSPGVTATSCGGQPPPGEGRRRSG